MHVFHLIIEVCVTAIKKYGYAFKKDDLNKQIQLIREPLNEHDNNAIKVCLDNEQIGYIKRQEAALLAPILDANVDLKVKQYKVRKYTSGYIMMQVYLKY